MKNQLLNVKAVQTGAHKAEVRAGVGSGAETSESRSRSWSRNKQFRLRNTARIYKYWKV
jgi:hypothetical protein